MSDRVPAPQPPIFNLQAYSPAEIKEAVEKVGVKKANLPPSRLLHAGDRRGRRNWLRRPLLHNRCQ